ncbi:LysM domain-containing protein [Apiospora hydei]|uniref:LysM domain-containing protein n=1 Tax=Apiospora hydei TaxID=1337664 RepID=A0ABR1X7R5_9PEZI
MPATTSFTVLATLIGAALVSAYTVDPPTTAPADTIQDCTNWAVATSSDTCESLAEYGFITLDDVYRYNPSLKASGCPIIIGNSYCIEQNFGLPIPTSTSAPPTSSPTSTGITTPTPTQSGMISSCNAFYKVQSGDTCNAIASSYGISVSEFYAWNPAVKTDCSLLFLDFYVCHHYRKRHQHTHPDADRHGRQLQQVPPSGLGDTCGAIASDAGISIDDFYAWNPAVKTDCSLLFLDFYVCIGTTTSTPTNTGTSMATTTTTTAGNGISTPTPTQAGMAGNCDAFYLVQSGDNCAAIASSHGISLPDLYAWNPAIGSGCEALWGNGVATPTPTQAGMTDNCRAFHLVASGDNCGDIASAAHVSLSDFYAWNPSVGSDCASLWLGYYVCIGLL